MLALIAALFVIFGVPILFLSLPAGERVGEDALKQHFVY